MRAKTKKRWKLVVWKNLSKIGQISHKINQFTKTFTFKVDLKHRAYWTTCQSFLNLTDG